MSKNLKKTDDLKENKKWVLSEKTKPKLLTVRRKAKELPIKNYKEQKAELKRRLEENTQKLDIIKKARKNFNKKAIVLK